VALLLVGSDPGLSIAELAFEYQSVAVSLIMNGAQLRLKGLEFSGALLVLAGDFVDERRVILGFGLPDDFHFAPLGLT
jgi:hypothetical protein